MLSSSGSDSSRKASARHNSLSPIDINRTNSDNGQDKSPNGISVRRLDTFNNHYDRIIESEDESRDSSQYSGTSSERRRNKEMRQSNIFLMKVIHGRVPNELLASRITSTDRENLSTLIPGFKLEGSQAQVHTDTEEINLTY